ncbi:hypothetical protein BJX63DRAFT_380037 [Aspergillus granulosus]|uniref:G-patch domain-containing protein n=1 Tax=Aspergillus granulosus TaxID=176169 RepID=A0ABR4HZ56_9EURO
MTSFAATSTDPPKPQNKIDAYAYLIRHGWSGTGNPLNPDRAGGTRGGLGLTKPLLVARRSGNQGIGKKTTKDPTNQWWLRGFEDALKGVGTDAAASNGSTAGKANALTSELYRFFVRGEVVPGTLGDKNKDKEVGSEEKTKKREREKDDEGVRERKMEKRKRKAEKEARREARREKKEKKRAKKEKKALKALEKKRPEDDYPTPVSMDLDSADNGQEVPLDLKKLEKLKKEKKEKKKDKGRKEKSKKTESSSSDESSKRKSKKSKTS